MFWTRKKREELAIDILIYPMGVIELVLAKEGLLLSQLIPIGSIVRIRKKDLNDLTFDHTRQDQIPISWLGRDPLPENNKSRKME